VNKPNKSDMPDKPYDTGWKRLLDICAQDLLDWIARKVVFAGRRSEEFQTEKMHADLMLEGIYEDQRVLVHIEAQSTPDTAMAQRLLEYNVLAHRRYKCPVMSYVVYLKKGGERPPSPLQWHSPDGREILRFYYEDIELPDYAPEALFATELRGILPLIPFAAEGARREVVEQIIARLLPAHDTINKQLLVLTRLFASLAFGKEDQTNQEWLMRRFAVLQDILQDTPAFQQIFALGEEKGLEIGLEKGREEGLQQGLEKGRQAERQEIVQKSRETLLKLVVQRFPKLKTLARKQALLMEQPQILDDLILMIALARTQEEALDYLLTWDTQNETEVMTDQ